MNEHPVCRYDKSAKLLQVVEGTSEVERMVVSRILWNARMTGSLFLEGCDLACEESMQCDPADSLQSSGDWNGWIHGKDFRD